MRDEITYPVAELHHFRNPTNLGAKGNHRGGVEIKVNILNGFNSLFHYPVVLYACRRAHRPRPVHMLRGFLNN